MLYQTSGSEDDPAIVAAASTYVILTGQRLPFLNELCEAKGVVGEPVIFQTKDDMQKKRCRILGRTGRRHKRQP
jgi:hypothetical protein